MKVLNSITSIRPFCRRSFSSTDRLSFNLNSIVRAKSTRSVVRLARVGSMEDVDDETKLRILEAKQAVKEAGLVKRKVALHIGYVGTQYSGLQISPLDNVKTIEGVLQEALFKSGCVSEANSVSLAKVKWSRSSRTDKGVHALATVIAMKCLLDESRFDSDPEGLELADRISSFLPDEIRVFSVQRVNDGFFARKACKNRTYTYFVPVYLLTGSEEANESECLERFREALSVFCGRHPFHNYTKRKQYIENDDSLSSGKRRRKQDSEKVLEEDDDDPQQEPNLIDSTSNGTSKEEYESLLLQEQETGKWRFWKCEFKPMDDVSDRVVASHYRHILSFTAEEPTALVPGGMRCIQCSIKGHSFMLHQIRHMIGTAVAYARKSISPRILEASLKACMRINLPLAPPQPLILQGNEFHEFPSNKGSPAVVSKWSGDRLELREGAMEKQQEFLNSILLPEIDELLTQSNWTRWSEMLEKIVYDEAVDEGVKEALELHDQWVVEKLANKKSKEGSLQHQLTEQGIDRASWKKDRASKKKKSK